MTVNLQEEVYSEAELLTLLDIEKSTLDMLRLEKGFPFVRLGLRKRVYLASAVLAWLTKNQASETDS